jgi:predicted enzyme related to lactoylglutathione lyase
MTRVLINLDVPDLAAAETFYTQAFGLRVGRRFSQGVIELLGAESPWYLLHKPQGSAWSGVSVEARNDGDARGERGQRDYSRHWTPVHLDVVVDDLDVALARAQAAGAQREGPTHEQAWGRLALLGDPFGHGFCLVQFLGRGYDELL